MHQKKSSSELQQEIGEEESSNKNKKFSSIKEQKQKRLSLSQIQTTQFTINKPHLTVQIPSFTFPKDETFTSPSSLTHPHKRPITMQSQQQRHHHHQARPFSSPVHHHSQTHQNYTTKVLFWLPSCTTAIAPFAHKLRRSVSHACLLRFQFRFLILVSLPALYFFIYYPRLFFLFSLVSILAFSLTLFVSINTGLPTRFPSIRLLLRNNKLLTSFSLSKSSHNNNNNNKPVVWSIGSKPKTEKMPNSGCWVQVYSNGDVYEGEFHKGKCSGSGVFYYSMKGKYEGDWIDEKYDGYGVETWARGSRYRGQYRQGLRHGVGVYRFFNGDVYAGEWSNGQCHGGGIHTCEDGSKYIGEFKWGVKHGLGHYHFRNGDTYAGEYFSDKMHGFGIYLFGNGHRYEGAWHEGRRQGLGVYTFRNGESQSGHWQNGVLDVPSSENIQPGSPVAVSYAKVLNTVKEARQAAEKAYNVAKVEKRVNKAVAAANKAANAARVAAVKAVQKRMLHNNGDYSIV